VGTTHPIRLPSATVALLERDLAEITAAIELVAHRVATRVVLTGLEDPESIAGRALAFAQLNRVRFALERDLAGGPAVVIVGPLEA
jgi:hypothetical protein